MKDRDLIKIAIIGTSLGICGLWFLSEIMMPGSARADKVGLDNLDDAVKFEGVITHVSQRGNIVAFKLMQHNEIDVVVFDNLTLEEGDSVSLFGKISEYNGKVQIVADEITLND